MKKLVLELTPEQFARLNTLAGLMNSKPEHIALGLSLANLDSFGDEWHEWAGHIGHCIDFYGENGNASEHPVGHRIEDSAPQRLLRLAMGNAVR